MNACCCLLHTTISSTQVSVPVLLKNSLQLAAVRTAAAQHVDFDRLVKQLAAVGGPSDLAPYQKVVSHFAFEQLKKEFSTATT